jgi:hypothetical protein
MLDCHAPESTDYVVLAQSPDYTPSASNALVLVFRESYRRELRQCRRPVSSIRGVKVPPHQVKAASKRYTATPTSDVIEDLQRVFSVLGYRQLPKSHPRSLGTAYRRRARHESKRYSCRHPMWPRMKPGPGWWRAGRIVRRCGPPKPSSTRSTRKETANSRMLGLGFGRSGGEDVLPLLEARPSAKRWRGSTSGHGSG